MIYDYIITLKSRSHTAINWVSRFLYLFAIICYAYFFRINTESRLAYGAFIALITAWWVFIEWKARTEEVVYYRLGLSIAVLGWLLQPYQNYWLAAFYAICAVLERQVKFPEEIAFNENHVVVNSFPKRTIPWAEVSNAIIKDGILTVDFRNNKLIQKEIEDEVEPSVEKEFNAFCQQQLLKRP
jgi:hypothetical protein